MAKEKKNKNKDVADAMPVSRQTSKYATLEIHDGKVAEYDGEPVEGLVKGITRTEALNKAAVLGYHPLPSLPRNVGKRVVEVITLEAPI